MAIICSQAEKNSYWNPYSTIIVNDYKITTLVLNAQIFITKYLHKKVELYHFLDKNACHYWQTICVTGHEIVKIYIQTARHFFDNR